MAQELAATMKEGGSFSAKRGFHEDIEVEGDLIPPKRRCAITKKFETVDVVDLPR